MHFTTSVASFAVFALASATALSQRQSTLSGQATYYGGNVAGGACSFSTYTLPASIYGTALSDSNWDDAENCGACVRVTGPDGNSITAMVVDMCPGCGTNHLDLFPSAFSALANPTVGVIDVTWEYIDCPITSALSLVNKDGVSAYYFAMQVVNSNKRVASLEVSTDGGSTWLSTVRQTYNFFDISSGTGTTTVDVKITSIDGDVLFIDSVEIAAGASTTARSNFPSSSLSTKAAAVVVAASSSSTEAAVATSTSKAPIATSTADGVALFQEASSSAAAGTSLIISSTKYRTTSVQRTTTLSSTTIQTSTIYVYAPSSTSSKSKCSSVTANATALAAGADISVLTISTCVPTVLYNVVTVVPTSTHIPTSYALTTTTLASNLTVIPITSASAMPSKAVFTSSAASLQSSSIFLAACGAVLAFLFM